MTGIPGRPGLPGAKVTSETKQSCIAVLLFLES
jgi:hypothetical protein